MGEMYVNADTGEPINMPQNTGYVPTGASYKTDKADLLEKIRPDIAVEVIRHKLLGEELNAKSNEWEEIKAYQGQALTKVGAWNIANLMLSVSFQNTAISNLKDHEIKQRALSIAKTAVYMCLENWKEYGIKRGSQLNFIYEIVFSNTLVVLKQPEGEGIRKLLAGTINENRVVTSNENPEGWKGVFRRRGR